MDVQVADIMIHVHDPLPREELEKLEDYLRQDHCVITSCVSKEHGQLMTVTYDPYCTNTTGIIALFNRQGIKAELIGL